MAKTVRSSRTMPVLLACPLVEDRPVDILHQHVYVLERTYALQRNPVLEPQHAVLSAGAESVRKVPRDKVAENAPALGRHVARPLINGNRRPRPNDNVRHVRREPVRPVVQQDPVVGWLGKGDR